MKIIEVNNNFIIAEKVKMINREENVCQFEIKFEIKYNSSFNESVKNMQTTFFTGAERKFDPKRWTYFKDVDNSTLMSCLYHEFLKVWPVYKEAVKFEELSDQEKGFEEIEREDNFGNKYIEAQLKENKALTEFNKLVAETMTASALTAMCFHFYDKIYDRDTSKLNNLSIKMIDA